MFKQFYRQNWESLEWLHRQNRQEAAQDAKLDVKLISETLSHSVMSADHTFVH